MAVPDPFAAGAWADAFLEGVRDDARDQAAIELIGAVAARLTLLAGARACAATLYSVADLAATQHLPAEERGDG
jgi:hypothetical protein